MQTQLDHVDSSQNPSQAPAQLSENSAQAQSIKISNPYLQRVQRRFALITVVTPILGTVCALGLAWYLGGVGIVELSLLGLMYVATMFGVEVGLHRYFSHHSFQAAQPVRVLLGILGSMAAEGPVIQWASNHRRHHQYSDKPEDPHSPHHSVETDFSGLHGLFHAHVGWLFSSEITNTAFYGKDLLRDPLMTRVNRHYLTWIALGLIIPTLLGGVLTWSWLGFLKGLLWGGLVRIFLVHQSTWGTNSFSHVYGSRPFVTADLSTNNPWLVLPTLGGSWHNNHHAFPNSAITGLMSWQLDLSGWFIRILEKLGLVWKVQQPTQDAIAHRKKVASKD